MINRILKASKEAQELYKHGVININGNSPRVQLAHENFNDFCDKDIFIGSFNDDFRVSFYVDGVEFTALFTKEELTDYLEGGNYDNIHYRQNCSFRWR